MHALSSLIVVAALFKDALGAIGPTANLPITNKFITPDGFNRTSIVAGGVHPGPLITAKKGERLRLNVINSLTDNSMLRSTSIHWHGFFQRGSTWADGPTTVSQCPIAPGHSFLYDFDTGDQSGTFWYHSHFGTQYCDGLRGPIVVYDPRDPYKNLYDVDDESTVITLADWYHIQTNSIVGIPIADSTLINGKGRFVNGPSTDLAVVNVERGRRYRFRLVAMSCDANYEFSIDGHKLTIIEADSEATDPLTVDSLRIFAGQRYSVILEANQNVDNYWIRAKPNLPLTNQDSNQPFVGGINSGILRYKGARNGEPKSNMIKSPKTLRESDLHASAKGNPRAPGNAKDEADVYINLDIGFDPAATRFTINHTSFHEVTEVPVLLQILSGEFDAQDLLPTGSVYTLPSNKVIEVTIPNNPEAPGGPHPFHLHGHSFSVVKSAGAKTPNYKNPVRRDVVSIGNPEDPSEANSAVTIRFVTDNPGPWFLHCHIDFHLEFGLAAVFAEAPREIKSKNNPPPAWDKLCPIYKSLSATATSVSPVVTDAKIQFA